jgi:mannose-6-phosphate isomerase-like protein (cupin superfamily)
MENLAASVTKLIDLAGLSANAVGSGPQWGHASHDLNVTLLSWDEKAGVVAHVNDEVDVLMIVVAGEGEATVNGEVVPLAVGQALLIPKGVERAIRSRGSRFSYLSVHRARRGLMPTVDGKKIA